MCFACYDDRFGAIILEMMKGKAETNYSCGEEKTMDLATHKWFQYLNESQEPELLEEGLENLGLPPAVIATIRQYLPDASGNGAKQRRLAQDWYGKNWKVRWNDENSRTLLIKDIITWQKGINAVYSRVRKRISAKYGSIGDDPDGRGAEEWEKFGDGQYSLLSNVITAVTAMRQLVDPQNAEKTTHKDYLKGPGSWKTVRKALEKYLAYPLVEAAEREVVMGSFESTEKAWGELSAQDMFTRYRALTQWLQADPRNFPVYGTETVEDEETGRAETERTGPYMGESQGSLAVANEVAVQNLEKRLIDANIIHDFGDGFKWYDTGTNDCGMIVRQKCGHCGADSRLTSLILLIKQTEDAKDWSCYTTVGWNNDEKTIYQIKGDGPGTGNVAPSSKYYGYLDWFIEEMGVKSIEETGEMADDDGEDEWEELLEHIREHFPDVSMQGVKRERDTLANALNELFAARLAFPQDADFHAEWAWVDAGWGGDDILRVQASVYFSLPRIPLVPYGTPTEKADSLKEVPSQEGRDRWEAFSVAPGKDQPVAADALVKVLDNYYDDLDEQNSVQGWMKWQVGGQAQRTDVELPERYISYDVRLQLVVEGHDANSVESRIDDELWRRTDSLADDWEDVIGEVKQQFIQKGYALGAPSANLAADLTETGDGPLDEELTAWLGVPYDDGDVAFIFHGHGRGGRWQDTDVELPREWFPSPSTATTRTRKLKEIFGGDVIQTSNFGDGSPELIVDNKLVQQFLEGFGEEAAILARPSGGLTKWRLKYEGRTREAGTAMLQLKVDLTTKDSQKTVDDAMVAIRAINADPQKLKKAIHDALEARKKLYMDTNEDVFESQLMRVHNLLHERDENYDLRLFRMYMRVKIYKDQGGQIGEVYDEIRMIPNVTVVRGLGSKNYETVMVSDIEVKFGYVGIVDADYIANLLRERIEALRGVSVMFVAPKVEWVYSSLQDINEMAYGADRTEPLPTPRISLQNILKDWMMGVMDYDQLQSANHMTYHTMVPISEFKPWMDRWDRAPQDAYIKNEMYKSFIANGPTQAVVVAFGKNGVIKILANQEVVIFAKEAGLEEVPAIFQFQRQA